MLMMIIKIIWKKMLQLNFVNIKKICTWWSRRYIHVCSLLLKVKINEMKSTQYIIYSNMYRIVVFST